MRVLSGIRMRWVMRFLLPLLLALPVTGARPVAAQPPERAGEWEIIFQINNGQIFATWIGRIWDFTQGDGVIVTQRRVDISDDCQLFGGLLIGQEDITFDGVDDYVRCIIPNYQMIFASMEPTLVNCYCDFASPPYAAADISPVLSQTAQPVVYHNRLSFDVILADTDQVYIPYVEGEGNGTPGNPVDTANVNLGIARLNLHLSSDANAEKKSWQSHFFNPAQENGVQLWAGFDVLHYLSFTTQTGWAKFLAEAGFWEAVTPEHDDGFLSWESEAGPKFSVEELPEGFILGPGTPIYFGYNPASDAYFQGTMRIVGVDPGCRAH